MDGDDGHKPEKTIMTTQKTNFRKVCANSVTKCKDDCDDRVWYKPQKSSNNGQGSDSEMSEMSAMSDLKIARGRVSDYAQRP